MFAFAICHVVPLFVIKILMLPIVISLHKIYKQFLIDVSVKCVIYICSYKCDSRHLDYAVFRTSLFIG